MADETEGTKKPKTETVGKLPKKVATTLEGWGHYLKTVEELSKARKASEEAKDKIREVLLAKLEGQKLKDGTKITDEHDLDFSVDNEGTVNIFINLEKGKGRARSKDLSDLFSGKPNPRAA